jgi:hypothetical protein
LEVTDQAAVGYSDNIAKLNQNKTGNVGNVDQVDNDVQALTGTASVAASTNAAPSTDSITVGVVKYGSQIRISGNDTSVSGDGTLLTAGQILTVNIANSKFTGSAATDSIFRTYSNGVALKSGLHPVVSLITAKDGIGRVDDELTTRVTHMTKINDEFQFVSGTEKKDLITPRFQDNELADQVADMVEYAVGESKTMYFYYGIEKGTFIKDGELQIQVPDGFSLPTTAEADAALDDVTVTFSGLQGDRNADTTGKKFGFANKKQFDIRLLYLSQDGLDNVTVVDSAANYTSAQLENLGLSDKTDIPVPADDIVITGSLVKIKLRHLVGNQHFLQIKYHGKAPNLIGYYDRGAVYEGNKANETAIDVKTLFNVETIRNDLGNVNSIFLVQ